MFGGWTGTEGRMNDVYILDYSKMVCIVFMYVSEAIQHE